MELRATKATFDKYPAYKDSGVKWLGEIPEGWETLPGLSFITEGKDKNKGMKRKSVLSLSYGNIREKADEELTGLVPESFETYQLVNKGDLIFRPTDLQNDKVSLRSSISNYEGIITSAYLNLRIKHKASAKFYHYFFRAIDNNKIIYGLGSGLRQNISYLDFRRFLFPFPPKEEQTAIAHFLDDKTIKIDQAIAQKEKMIALLKERKQIIIQNAVTGKVVWSEKEQKMIPLAQSEVRVKDSGVEWIGEIPEHWEVKRLKYVAEYIQTGTTPSTVNPDFFNGGINWYNPKDLNKEMLINSEKTVSDKALNRNEIKIFEEDSVLIVGIGATTGKTAYMKNKGTFNQQITGFHSKKENNKYLFYLLRSIANVMLNVASYTTLPILNNEFFKSFWIVIPLKSEQPEIVSYIETFSAKINQAISLQQTQIQKLKEYKSTLIDSAVTGKINVS